MSLVALGRLAIADGQDRQIQRDIRDAIWSAYGVRRRSDETAQATEAQAGAYALLDMFDGGH